jgi:hypothetical protein
LANISKTHWADHQLTADAELDQLSPKVHPIYTDIDNKGTELNDFLLRFLLCTNN